MPSSVDAVVVGAGIIGLTTGIRLAEAGMRVLIRTGAPPAETTSALAGAMVGPAFALPDDRARAWEAVTREEVTGAPGVHVCRGMLAAREPGLVPPGYEPVEGPDGFLTAFWAELPMVDMPVYLEHLAARFTAAGGVIEIAPVTSLEEAAALAPRVANCSGLGARRLADDPTVVPVRGPRIVVENPGIDTFFMEAPFGTTTTSFIPHGETMVLGSIRAEGSYDTTPDAEEAEELVRRAALVEPRIEGVKILAHHVGLRPGRPEIRLEATEIGSATCVHNYGHSGIGVTVSWGCATEAAALLT
ncbi:NAD(P)/FAD-dependent oxidoreductase [Bailinhaonella thermotolerans]|uniref:D-amino-acid oxidase n=1 Tax=Bailinhaonella thermotolerans TaxID=1070861 RepID=A0A3A4A828_9ACTN|nr:FAD-binding oxidoreductase [Bailinhaonella thermotolerans]RJL24181.1 FAD-binding oxidoreductase [Bailinhaonella thermotolerans]